MVGVPGGDLDVAQVNAGVEHGRDERVAQHVWVHPGDVHAADFGEVVQASSGTVSVHPGAAAGSQDRSRGAGVDGAVDGAGYCRWQGCQDYLAAFAGHA